MNRCVRHPDRPVSALDLGDRLCTECFFRAWNAGARWAGAHWADTPVTPYADEQSTDGRSILKDHQGFYKRKPGDV